ncbi:MAG: NAD/NADP octopine/nopaline dehydrogenase family protein [Deltaproteobacteria bacterium]|nr:NAD/NADP octopine/nopaline dehydrogenase family protein [Deltaproteobacteria bacterium]
MSNEHAVAVLGGGNGAFAVAADLTLKGFDVRLLEVPEYAKNLQSVRDYGGIDLINPGIDEFESGFAKISTITIDPKEAIEGASIILFVVPGYAERRFIDLIKPFIKKSQLVVFFCGVFGGSLEFAYRISLDPNSEKPLIAEVEALLYGAIKFKPNGVRLTGRKKGLAVASFPTTNINPTMNILSEIVPDLSQARNVIETGLRNANIVLHPPVFILNAGRVHTNEEPFRFYWDGVNEHVGKIVRALDEERLRIGKALGLRISSTRERLLSWYGDQGARGDSLWEVMSTNPVYKSAVAPDTFNHRFITEDVPYGLVPLEEIGCAMELATPITSALITMASELTARDYRADGRTLKKLGLSGLSPDQIISFLDGKEGEEHDD